MKKVFLNLTLILTLFLAHSTLLTGQPGTAELMNAINDINSKFENIGHRFDILEKRIDDVQWYNKVGDIAYIDKVYITGPALAKEKNTAGQGAGNRVKF